MLHAVRGERIYIEFQLFYSHGPLTKGRIVQRFLSEGVMETFSTKMFNLAYPERAKS
jgi:hypothetical protein